MKRSASAHIKRGIATAALIGLGRALLFGALVVGSFGESSAERIEISAGAIRADAIDVATHPDSDYDFLAVWCEDGVVARGQIQDVRGFHRRGPFTIAGGSSGCRVAVTALNSRDYFVVAAFRDDPGGPSRIVGTSVLWDGHVRSPQTLAVVRELGDIDVAAAYPLGTGLMVVWAEQEPAPQVRGLLLDDFGRKRGSELVIARASSSDSESFSDVAITSEYRRYVVAHSRATLDNSCAIAARSVSFDGKRGSHALIATQSRPESDWWCTVAIAFNPRAPETLLVWQIGDTYGRRETVHGRVLPLGSFGTRNFVVLGRTLGTAWLGWDATHFTPAVTAGPDASFLVAAEHYLEHRQLPRRSFGLTVARVVRGIRDGIDFQEELRYPSAVFTRGTLVTVGERGGIVANVESESPLW